MSPPPEEPPRAWTRDLFSLSEEETLAVGEALGRTLAGGEVILLEGELGAGKTVLVRGIAAGLGIDPAEVGSPTFVLVDRYQGRLALYHADLYRLDDEEGIFELGLEDFILPGAVLVVEWGERLPSDLRRGGLRVRITDLGEDARRIRIGAAADEPAEPTRTSQESTR